MLSDFSGAVLRFGPVARRRHPMMPAIVKALPDSGRVQNSTSYVTGIIFESSPAKGVGVIVA
jgi:hypothetical protein